MESTQQRGCAPVPIEVDASTGRWSVHDVPMVLVPQHLLTNSLAAVEEALGRQAAATALREAGRRSAWQWCAHEAAAGGFTGVGIIEHYLDQLSRRGWGQFHLVNFDLSAGTGAVTVTHSALAARAASNQGACYPFGAWLEGAVGFARGDSTVELITATETSCVSTGSSCCVFELATVPNPSLSAGVRSDR